MYTNAPPTHRSPLQSNYRQQLMKELSKNCISPSSNMNVVDVLCERIEQAFGTIKGAHS
jgi:hypothetical protein